MLRDYYSRVNEISYILSDSSDAYFKDLYMKMSTAGMIVKKTPVRFLIEKINSEKTMDNSNGFYNIMYKNNIPFITLWEVILYDQIINIIFKKRKTILESIETFKSLNQIDDFDYVKYTDVSNIQGYDLHTFHIGNNERNSYNDFVISHPNLCLDNITGEPLNSWDKKPTYSESAKLINNIIEASRNRTNLLVLPELYVYIHWLHFIGYTSQLFEMNITMGLKNILVSGVYFNLLISTYHFRDRFSRRNLFVTTREKNFYAYDEIEWCTLNHCVCINNKKPIYFAVNVNDITFSDYVCYEVTDILSRAVFKGYVDMIVIPMLNKDTNYFDSIIRSLSRDLSCVVVTSNSASWGNSSIIIPKETAKMILTEFKGGFNQYLVSTKVPIYELIEYNTKFTTREKDSKYKPHSANFDYHKKIERFDF